MTSAKQKSVRRNPLSPTAQKLFPSGAWEVSDIVNNHLVRRVYYGVSKTQALAEFRRELQKPRRNPDIHIDIGSHNARGGRRVRTNPVKPYFYVSVPNDYARSGFGIDAVTPIPWVVHRRKRLKWHTLYFWLPDQLTTAPKFRAWIGNAQQKVFDGSANEMKRFFKSLLP